MAIRAAETATRAGSFLANCKAILMKGSKVPASRRIPKKRMAKMNITPIGAIPRIPEVMYSGNCVPIPAISPMIKGMLIIATIADNFFDMMAKSTRPIMRIP